jgi:hypothetical protein
MDDDNENWLPRPWDRISRISIVEKVLIALGVLLLAASLVLWGRHGFPPIPPVNFTG